MIVGGRAFNLSRADVESRMRGEAAEPIRKYVVEVNGAAYPPKQVLGHVTGWTRTSFTTMEAQRVLTRLGFVCREGKPGPWVHTAGGSAGHELGGVSARITALEAAVTTAQEAIAGLAARVKRLEAHAG
jgi:hypothetical protein